MIKRKGMDNLISRFSSVEPRIVGAIKSRLEEFQSNSKDPKKIFSELCFCICTANNSAERGIRAQEKIDFYSLPEPDLRKSMREIVCRFYNNKTRYILSARSGKDRIISMIASTKSGKEAREWIVENVPGLGFKEASHFLRNIGYTDVAIIDFHIIDLLVDEHIIKRPKSVTKLKYLEIEKILESIAAKAGVNLAELDLYLWYLETGKVLK
jgi:N-glycosylase/DNA lyase